MSLQYHGRLTFRDAIKRDLDHAQTRTSDPFELMAPVPLSAVCFRHRAKDNVLLRRVIARGRVPSNATIGGHFGVVLLTINGIVVERSCLPAVMRNRGRPFFASLQLIERSGVVAVAAISAVSWYFVVALGVVKELNFAVGAASILEVYGLLLAAAIAAGVAMVWILPGRAGAIAAMLPRSALSKAVANASSAPARIADRRHAEPCDEARPQCLHRRRRLQPDHQSADADHLPLHDADIRPGAVRPKPRDTALFDRSSPFWRWPSSARST